jgi:hypothetical protein
LAFAREIDAVLLQEGPRFPKDLKRFVTGALRRKLDNAGSVGGEPHLCYGDGRPDGDRLIKGRTTS